MSGPVRFTPIGYKKPKVQTPQRHFEDEDSGEDLRHSSTTAVKGGTKNGV